METKAIKLDAGKIKTARGTRGVMETAKELGISRQHLWQVESGRMVPSGDILARLCIYYQVPVEDLVRVGKNSQPS